MKRGNLLLLLALLTIITVSCKKEKIVPVQPTDVEKIENNDNQQNMLATEAIAINGKLKSFARYFAEAIEQKEIRKLVKREALKKFDGDYSILYKRFKKIRLGTKSVESAISAAGEGVEASLNSPYNIKAIADEFPLLNISIPVNIEKWDAENYAPLVAVMTTDYDEATTQKILAYDSNGNEHWLDTRKNPEQPVIVIGFNERVTKMPSGELRLTSEFNSFGQTPSNVDRAIEKERLPCPECGGPMVCMLHGGIGGGPGPLDPVDPDAPATWFRQNFKYESITEMNFGNIGAIEGWPAGAPEIRVYTYSYNFNTDSIEKVYHGQIKPSKRSDINDKWWDCPDYQMHLWQWYDTGTEFKYGFYEYDYSPISVEQLEPLSDFAVALLDALGVDSTGTKVVEEAFNVIGIFLPMKNHKSEFMGQILIHAQNSRTEFACPGGSFQFRSKPL